MLVRHPILFPINKFDYNNNNLHQFDPYILKDDKIIIDKVWWKSLSKYTQSLISTKLTTNYELGIVEIPHDIQKDNESKMLNIVYQSYLDGFDYNIWYDVNIPNGPQNVNMIHVPNVIKKILKDIFKTGVQNNSDELLNFKNEINKCLVKHNSYFIRLSSTSGKNENSLVELHNTDQIIKHLSSNKLFVFQEYERMDKDTFLIIIPWNENINERHEFRIFVVNGKLVGASIQKWWDLIQHSSEELEIFEHVLSNIQFLNSFENKTFIADVYVNVHTESCHLIEVNPFGAHCGAGSSLFNWITDYDLLHGKNEKIELRYLSLINY